MKNIIFFLASYILFCGNCKSSNTDFHSVRSYDVVIYGGSSGGFTAAIQIAKMGKKVVLLEPTNHVGGMNVEGLGGTDIDNHSDFQNSPAVGGLALEFYKRIAIEYDRIKEFEEMLKLGTKNPKLWRFEPKVAQKVINDWLDEYSIEVFTNAKLINDDSAVHMEDGRIISIVTTRGVFRATFFMDATIEGDLLYKSNVSTIVGREPNSRYNETKNGIRGETLHNQLRVKVDPYQTPGDPSSGVITGVFDEPLGIPGNGDHRIQAYCYRVCLTNNEENRIPFLKPSNYKRENYLLFERYLRAGGELYRPSASLPNHKADFNGGRDVSHNLNGMNYNYPDGNYAEREKILKYHEDFTRGLFYFLANDSIVGQLDPALQDYWSQWGLPKDEFLDNNHWPRVFYVRDARRMISDYVITEHHTKKIDPTPVSDPVALAYWPPDVHNVRTIIRDGWVYNEGFVFGGNDWQPFGISFQSLVPKSSECNNLITPTCISSSHIGYGAIRIEFTFMALGQAAGAATVLAMEQGSTIQNVNYSKLKQVLLKGGQVLSLK